MTWYLGWDRNAGTTAQSPPPLILTGSPATSAVDNSWGLLKLWRLSFLAQYNNYFWGEFLSKHHNRAGGHDSDEVKQEGIAAFRVTCWDSDKMMTVYFLKHSPRSAKILPSPRCLYRSKAYIVVTCHYRIFLSFSTTHFVTNAALRQLNPATTIAHSYGTNPS